MRCHGGFNHLGFEEGCLEVQETCATDGEIYDFTDDIKLILNHTGT
jgi:hypothetical protein